MHCSPVPQARLQAPQLLVLVWRLTQVLGGPPGVDGQVLWPVGHAITQVPLLQA